LYPNPTVGYRGEEIRGGAFRGGEQGFFVSQEIVLGGKLALAQNAFEQEKRQAATEADEQRLRVLSNVQRIYVQALAAQQIVELRRNLSQLAQGAVQTSEQLVNVGQADVPDQLEAEVEAQQADLALTTAEQERRRVWKELAATVGSPKMPMGRLEGDLERIPDLNVDQWIESLVRDSPAVKIAELGVAKAEASLKLARREPIPDLELRGGFLQDRELLETTAKPVGLIGFAEVGVKIPLFNRNQGAIQAGQAELDRAQGEVERVKLLLRERAAGFVQSYLTSRAAAEKYKNQMIPRARQAYDLYLERYKNMAAAYPQVLIAQRTYFQLQAEYVAALENLWTASIAINSFLLTDGLEAPSRPTEMDRPVREVDVPSGTNRGPQQR